MCLLCGLPSLEGIQWASSSEIGKVCAGFTRWVKQAWPGQGKGKSPVTNSDNWLAPSVLVFPDSMRVQSREG
jgi:hypothetical protein